MSLNKILDKDIDELKHAVEVIIEETKIQYASTFEVVKTNNFKMAKKIISQDKIINDLQNEYTNLALWKISKQNLVARDLRLAVGTILICREIERIADYAKLICKFCISYKPSKIEIDAILEMFELIIHMLDMISNLFNNYNKDQTKKVMKMESDVKQHFKKLFDEMFLKVRTVKTKDEALSAFNAIMQLKNLDRAADHLISVQEIMSFIRTGEFDEVVMVKNQLKEVKN